MKILSKPNNLDLFILSCFVILITFQPEIEIMEWGIHLPALNAMFHKAVPYRDVFYLRGPLELYGPFWMMLLFGKTVMVLTLFYYLGTIATLLIYAYWKMPLPLESAFLFDGFGSGGKDFFPCRCGILGRDALRLADF